MKFAIALIFLLASQLLIGQNDKTEADTTAEQSTEEEAPEIIYKSS